VARRGTQGDAGARPVGCNIWLTDMADRPPRVLKNDEVIDLGGKKGALARYRARPHNWSRIDLRETTGTLFWQ